MTFPRIAVSLLLVVSACAQAPAQEMSEEMIKAASSSVTPVLPESPEKPAPEENITEIQAAKPEPVRAQVILPSAKPSAAVDVMDAEWAFLKASSESKDDDVAAAVLPQLSRWIRAYPAGGHADEALLLKGDLQFRLGDYRAAIMTYLRHTQEYPVSKLNALARQQLNIAIDKKLNKKFKAPLNAIAGSPATDDKAENIAVCIRQVADKFGEDFYAPVLEEFNDFSVRFPSYAGGDALQLALGGLYARKGEYLLARLAFEKLIAVRPDSRLLVQAKRALGDVLANDLKDYFAAIKVYQDITVNFAGTPEAWAAYLQLPRLTERQKQYQHAVDVYEKIIALYPDKPEAREAYRAEARVLREELKKPAEAIAVLNRLADKYKDEKIIEELYLAAEIARKDLKDLAQEVKMYDRIAAEYPTDPEAPKALMTAGKAFEKAKDVENAKLYFQKIVDTYPQESIAKKAQGYITALTPQEK